MNKLILNYKKKIDVTLLIVLFKGNNLNELRKTMKSIFFQRHIPNQIIIIQNGNLESNLAFYLRNLINTNNYCKLFKLKENKGLAFALNLGLKFSKNNLIARIDPDDEIINDRFYLQKKFFNLHHQIDVLGGFAIEKNIDKERLIKKPQKNSNIYSALKFKNPFIHSTIMFSKKSIIKLGGYPDIYKCQDYLLWIKCLENNIYFMNLDIALIITNIDKKMMKRRNFNYFKYEFVIYNYMYKKKIIKFHIFIFNVVCRLILRSLPMNIKLFLYKLLR